MIYYYHNHRWRQGYVAYSCAEWWMLQGFSNQYRHSKTTQERRRWFQDIDEDKDIKWRKLGRSPLSLNPWGIIEKRSRWYETKSWKKLYKVKNQWKKPKRKYIL